jgi:hypothetical protein
MAQQLNCPGDRGSLVRVRAVREHHVGAGRGKRMRNTRANAASTAGHYRDLVLKRPLMRITHRRGIG